SIIECQNAISLVAVSEKPAAKCVASYQRNYRMSRHPCRCLCLCQRSRREEDTGRFLTVPVSLALDVNDCDDGTLRFTRFIAIFGDNCSNVGCESECFFESNLPVADTRKTAVLVRYNAEEEGCLISNGRSCGQHGVWITAIRCVASGQGFEPCFTAQPNLFLHRTPSSLLAHCCRNVVEFIWLE